MPETVSRSGKDSDYFPVRDGMYQVVFRTRLGFGAGFVALHHGIICGGDRGVSYSGTYEHFGNDFTAGVEIEHHGGRRVPTVFGNGGGFVRLEGRSTRDGAKLVGASQEFQGLAFHAVLRRVPD